MGLGPTGPRLRKPVYTVRVCGADVGGIGGASSRMELLGQPVVALTADRPAQGPAQVQERAAHGHGEREVRIVRGAGAGGAPLRLWLAVQ